MIVCGNCGSSDTSKWSGYRVCNNCGECGMGGRFIEAPDNPNLKLLNKTYCGDCNKVMTDWHGVEKQCKFCGSYNLKKPYVSDANRL